MVFHILVHQQPRRRYNSSTGPIWRPDQGRTASCWGLIKKLQIMKSSWNLISVGVYYMNNWPILKKKTPLVVHVCIMCICGSRAKIKKSAHTCLFASSNTFQNCMSWSRSTNSHGGDSLQGKGLDAAPVLQGEDWTQVLPTQYLPGTNQTSPENFIQICPSIQKLFFNWANSGLFFVYFRLFKQTL